MKCIFLCLFLISKRLSLSLSFFKTLCLLLSPKIEKKTKTTLFCKTKGGLFSKTAKKRGTNGTKLGFIVVVVEIVEWSGGRDKLTLTSRETQKNYFFVFCFGSRNSLESLSFSLFLLLQLPLPFPPPGSLSLSPSLSPSLSLSPSKLSFYLSLSRARLLTITPSIPPKRKQKRKKRYIKRKRTRASCP